MKRRGEYCTRAIGGGFGIFAGAAPAPRMANLVGWIVHDDADARMVDGYMVSRPERRRWRVQALGGQLIAEADNPAHGLTIMVRLIEANKAEQR